MIDQLFAHALTLPTLLAGAVGADGQNVGAAEEKVGMPQLKFETFEEQIVWLLISFGLLFLLMWRVVLPPVTEVLQSREERIAGDLDAAERLNKEAEEAFQAYELALADARAKASSIAHETREKVQAQVDAKRAEVDAQLAQKASEAEESIRAAKQEALGHVEHIAAETATAVVAHLLGRDADQTQIDHAVSHELTRRKGEA